MLPLPIAQSSGRGMFEFLGAHTDWILLGIILLAFLIFGAKDLARLSWARISAISSVSFQESIRRRVLWITPLAILGAIVVSQLQVAVDPQDAIRQTTKICLFATGLVVTLTAIILACTSLPKEIENRVIYTVVTKPTTRLEIVLGKVWGFAKVSAAILLIMGLFTYTYLHVRAWRLSNAVDTALAALPPDAPNRDTLVHYRDHGLLNAKAMSEPTSLQVLAEPPVDGQPRWMAGGQGQQFVVDFALTQRDYAVVEEAIKAGGRMSMFVELGTEVREPTAAETEVIRQTNIPTADVDGAAGPSTGPAAADVGVGPEPPADPSASTQPADARRQLPLPVLGITIRNQLGDYLLDPDKDLNHGRPILLPVGAAEPVEVPIDPTALDKLFETGRFDVYVEARSPAVRYSAGDRPVTLRVLGADGKVMGTIEAEQRSERPPITSLTGRFGQQIIGGPEGQGGVAVFRFQNADLPPADGSGKAGGGADDALTFEIRAGIERGGDGPGDVEMLPDAQLRIRDPETGAVSEPFPFRPETNRISYVRVPRSAFPPDGGTFEALVRVLTPDQWLGMKPASVALATGSRAFSLNLVKSLLILWLLSVLVVAIAVFCSTFLSWPIAVVLTLVLLLGRWGVQQLSDASGGSLELGSQITAQSDPVTGRVVRESVDALGNLLELVAKFLPDVSSFQATADIERGISVSGERLARAGWVLLGYGAPIVMLAYLILKRKEVAP